MTRSSLATLAALALTQGMAVSLAHAADDAAPSSTGEIASMVEAMRLNTPPTFFGNPFEAIAPAPVSPRASYLLSDKLIHGEPEVLYPGFLSGMRGFEHFTNPTGDPLYFESPFIQTNFRFVYLRNNFSDGSQLAGGQATVTGYQARIALNERLAIIAPKDGHSWLRANALPKDDGWNDIALGAKYAFYIDRDNDAVATLGLRWFWGNGDAKILQGGVQELSPFITAAKGWGDFHLMGNITGRAPVDDDKGNNIIQWGFHADYDLGSLGLKGVSPVIELHGLHYLSDGTRTPLMVGGLDYANLGSTMVSGSTVIWMGWGARFKISPNLSVGAVYEHALTNVNADILEDRVTVDIEFTW